MALAGGDEIGIDIEVVTFDADFAVYNRLAARMIGETERNCGFVGHREFLSQLTEFGVPIVPIVPEVPISSEACGTFETAGTIGTTCLSCATEYS
jgi:hypothetical protein